MEVLFKPDRETKADRETRVVALAPGAETDALIQLFERVAAELSWHPGDQLRACQGAARHLAIFVGEELAGGLQVVMGGGRLPFQNVWPEVEVAGAATAHVTILALEKPYRGRYGLFGPVCVELWRCCRDRQMQQIVIEATPQTLRLYQRLGWPLKIIGELRLHWGEECYLCCMGVGEVADALTDKAARAASCRALVDQAYRDRLAGVPVDEQGLTLR